MSIFKSEHTDGSGNLLLHLIARITGHVCPSRVHSGFFSDGEAYNYKCTLTSYHAGRHRDVPEDVSWAYGDEFFADCGSGQCSH